MPDPLLEPRRRPRPGRARKTVEGILDATAALLDEEGFDALSTNHIAERAGVNVASLYKYFPNKYAVLVALAEQMRDEQLALLEGAPPGADDWRAELSATLAAFLDFFRTRRGFRALDAALKSSPRLREIEEQSLAAEARAIAKRLAAYGLPGGRAQQETVARVLLEAVRGILPRASAAGPAARKRLMRELERMLEAYLAGLLEPPRSTR